MATEMAPTTKTLRPRLSIRRPAFIRSVTGARFVSLLLGAVPGFGRAPGRSDRHRLTTPSLGRPALGRRPIRAF
jgi:hypothetical protein